MSSPLCGRYLIQNRAAVLGLTIADRVLDACLGWGGSRTAESIIPRQILVSIGGHLGDAVIASSLLPLIAETWPEAEIGLLMASWARPVLEGHPLVRRIHVVDHWKSSRRPASRAEKLRRYWSTRRQALREIRATRYDLALELHPYFPNAIPLLWQAGIPVRVGYTSGGFGAMLTHRAVWRSSSRHMTEYHRDLLRLVAPVSAPTLPLYSLPAPARERRGRAHLPSRYVVIHMGAGLKAKEWPLERWHSLAGELLHGGHALVFTGSGSDQVRAAEQVIDMRANCFNLCGRLGWGEFAATLAGARLVISVDSVAGHLAAGLGTPVVVLMSGINPISQWRPVGGSVAVITHAVPCSPCYRGDGCEGMACIRGISVDDVFSAARTLLATDASV